MGSFLSHQEVRKAAEEMDVKGEEEGAWKDSWRRWEKKLSKVARRPLKKEPALKASVPANETCRSWKSILRL